MSTRAKIEFAIAIALLALIALAGKTWLQEHDEKLLLKGELARQTDVITGADSRIKQRDDALQQSLAELERLKAQKPTPQQIVREIPQLIPGPLPKAILEPAPNAPSVQVPVEDLATFRDFALNCKECDAKLAAANGNATDAAAKLQAMTAERDAALKVVHGGTKWTRIGRAMKWMAIGAGVGLAAGQVLHH